MAHESDVPKLEARGVARASRGVGGSTAGAMVAVNAMEIVR